MTTIKVPRQTIVDRVVGYFAPGLALSMLRDRTMLSAYTGQGGYKGGRRDRRATRNWHPGGGSADADLLPQLTDLRGRSRDLARNLPVATGAIQTNRTHVIGEGLVLNAQCNRKALGITEEQATAWNETTEAEWQLFCRSADFTSVQHFADLQAMLFGGVLESGDIFAIRRFRRDPGDAYGTKVQVIEADMVSNPNWMADTDTLVAGIEHTRQGVPVAVHVTDRHPGDRRRTAVSWRRVPMRYNDGRQIVVHLFDRLRPTQTRGIPYLAPVVEALKSLGDYTDAEVRAAVVSAMFTVFVKGAPSPETGPLASTDAGGTGREDEIELGAGAVVDLAEGEDIVTANPGRPNPQFDAFVTAFLRQIGVALELPFELLIKHFTASYSASRAALEMAYHSFRRRRSWFVRQFMEPVYGWFLEEAVLTGRIDAPGFFDDPAIRAAWMRATWTGPVRISLDPKKDAEADKIDVEQRVKTRQQVLTERTGGDFDQKVEQVRREEAALEGLSAASPSPAPMLPSPDDEEDDDA
ncbi:MAG: phage portal protein [Stappia sp.]|uniref:phage portal protein n=1 Tax=Stappia sp. TaxID=1870903 RepID=UPI000C6AD0A1|nr:phage portal protein [Stappia sp.]MAB00112.1 phage portal protein [Stappia sp.]MBM20751.1 phage portal protein [Stappia sp.]|tara:strand:- start:193 stop:1764 length:1572 start_codon:yes stop_codon:yes gene_type:complete